MGGVVAAQYLECNTVAVAPDLLVYNKQAPYYDTTLTSADIACFIHVLREADGSGGLTATEIDSMFSVAASDLEDLSVNIYQAGQVDLANSSYYAAPDFYAADLFADNPNANAIDIYLGPSTGVAVGRASGIPGSSLVLTGNLDSYSALSHLLGNCLGLYATDEWVAFGSENPDGSNGETTGDLISDTAADPGLTGWVQEDCSLSAGFNNAYNPDPTNIMSNSRMTCWFTFTEEQRDRALMAIESYDVLQDAVLVFPDPSVYGDYTEQTDLPNLIADIPFRSNAVGFDFRGLGNRIDLIFSGHARRDTLNKGHAFECTGFDDSGVPYFDNFSSTTFADPPQCGTLGMITADYDNDGDLDFYAPNLHYHYQPGDGTQHRMYRNEGNGTFSDVSTTVFGSLEAGMGSIHGSWADYDGDGYLDLLVGINNSVLGLEGNHHMESLKLYHNEQIEGGGPTARMFVDKTEEAGITVDADSTRSFMWVDFDQDHDMDLVVFAYIAFGDDNDMLSRYYQNNGGTFSDVTDSLFGDRVNLQNGKCAPAPSDVDNDGDIDIVYHGQTFRGFFRNNYFETGEASLNEGWHLDEPANSRWLIEPTDIKVFDFDLDGWLDFGLSNSGTQSNRHRVFHNTSQGNGFVDCQLDSAEYRARGLCAVDWNRDGFTELVLAAEGDTPIFFRNENAISGANTNHWVGISLRADVLSCNYFGIGATVIVSAGGHRQAQIIDGGSGNAGQNSLDLTFGLGSYGDVVDVEVIWPCGQTQYAIVQPDMYTTLELAPPEITTNSAKGYLGWAPGQSDVSWVFEWETTHPSDMTLDQIEFPNGVMMDSEMVYFLEDSTPFVEFSVTMTPDGKYQHFAKWHGRPCDQAMLVLFRVHSRAQDQSFTQDDKLRVVNCPLSF